MDLKVNVVVGGGQKGADEIKKLAGATDAVASAAKDANKETKESANLLEQLGSRSGQAREAIEGLESATRGGAAGIFGVAKAARAVIEGLKLNPFSFLLGAAIALVPVLIEVGSKMFGVGEAAKKTGDEVDRAAQKAEKLGATRLENLRHDLDEVDASATRVTSSLRALDDIVQKLDDAKQAIELAGIDADATLDSNQKKAASLSVVTKYTKRRRAREDELLGTEVSSATSVAAQKQSIAADKKAAAEQQQALVDALPDADRARRQIETIRAGQAVPMFQTDLQKAKDKTDLKDAAAEIAAAESDRGKRRREREETELKRREAEEKTAAEEARVAARKADEVKQSAEDLKSPRAILRDAEDNLTRMRSGVPVVLPPPVRASLESTGRTEVSIGGRQYGRAPATAPDASYGAGPSIKIGDDTFAGVSEKLAAGIGASAAAALERSSQIIINGVDMRLKEAEARVEQRLKALRN